ncbi:hypothetical protein LCGC14_2989050 [marine sediment metagenome]|uniref:Uncharacterized protein n=1 Tax=marine sediment metagenome TaxID=412755 RepID=A0A0F8ZVF9_9ZZZZ
MNLETGQSGQGGLPHPPPPALGCSVCAFRSVGREVMASGDERYVDTRTASSWGAGGRPTRRYSK